MIINCFDVYIVVKINSNFISFYFSFLICIYFYIYYSVCNVCCKTVEYRINDICLGY